MVKIGCRLGYCVNLDTFVDGIANLPFQAENDTDAMGYCVISIVTKAKIYAVGTHIIHIGGESKTPSYLKLGQDLKTKVLHSTTRMQHPYGFIEEFDGHNPRGVRITYNTATFKVDAEFLKQLARIYFEEVEPLRHVNGFVPGMITQTLAKDEIAQFQRNGGNAFGIKEEDGPLISKPLFEQDLAQPLLCSPSYI